MSERPGLSIVVGSYNYGRYLRAAIESTLDQTYPKTEVLVVDDGSTDDSPSIITSFGDRIRSHFQPNQGQVASCTSGLRLCSHDIIIFLDSDDLLLPHAAETIIESWRPGTAKVQYALQAIDDQDRLLPTVFPKYPYGLTPDRIREAVLQTGFYPATTTSGTAFSRSFLEEVLPIPAEYDCCIDDAMNPVAPLHGSVIALNRVLGHYRVHAHNASCHATLNAARFERYARDCEERHRFLRNYCAPRGIELAPNLLQKDFDYLENKLAAAVLAPSPRLGLLLPTLRAALGSCLDPGQRAMHAAWAFALALGPRPLARRLLEQRFIFNRRSRLIEGLLRQTWRLGRISSGLFGRLEAADKAARRPA